MFSRSNASKVINHPSAAILHSRTALFHSILDVHNLAWVWKFVEENNTGRDNTYHNNAHMMSVARGCWEFYNVERHRSVTYIENALEVLLVAAMLHDFDHTGGVEDDEINIARAIAGVERIAGSLDKQFFDGFSNLVISTIKVTQYPFVHSPTTMPQRIIRDVDGMQSYEPNGLELIMEGLRSEMVGRLGYLPTYTMMYKGQIKFLATMELYTDVGKAIVKEMGSALIEGFKAYAEAAEPPMTAEVAQASTSVQGTTMSVATHSRVEIDKTIRTSEKP